MCDYFISNNKKVQNSSSSDFDICYEYYFVSGVDNNGSGMTAFMEVARLLALAKCPREYTVLLVANDLEETVSV